MADENAKENAVQQAQFWAQEARTQRETVLSILRYFGLPERDYEALRLVRHKVESVAASWDECYSDAPGGEVEVGPAIRRALVAGVAPLPEPELPTAAMNDAGLAALRARRHEWAFIRSIDWRDVEAIYLAMQATRGVKVLDHKVDGSKTPMDSGEAN